MEFNIFEHFKGMGISTNGPTNHYEQGANYFSSGHLGAQVRNKLDSFAERVNMPRRSFMKTICGFTGAMLAVNQATGMPFLRRFRGRGHGAGGGAREECPAEVRAGLRR